MKNPLLTKFKSRIKANAAEYKPKFEVGDYIINTWKGLKLVCEVVAVGLYSKDFHKVYVPQPIGSTEPSWRPATNEEKWGLEVGEYTLLDIVNEHSNMQSANKANGVHKIYKRHRDIRKIDSTYTKVDAAVAQVLYGKKV